MTPLQCPDCELENYNVPVRHTAVVQVKNIVYLRVILKGRGVTKL